MVRRRESLRSRVNTFCRECIYDSDVKGSWRAQVETCTAKACPLYPVRPKRTTAEKRAEKAKEMTT